MLIKGKNLTNASNIFHFRTFNYSLVWSYGAIGILLATMLITINRKRANMSDPQVSTLVFIAIIGGVIGSRITYVMQNWSAQFRDNLLEVFRIDHGGLVFYGGFFLAVGGIIVYCHKSKLDMVRVLDVFTPAMAMGHAMGRIGCFMNGCCYGNVTHSWLGVHYPEGSAPWLRYSGAPLHPVQIYEAWRQYPASWHYVSPFTSDKTRSSNSLVSDFLWHFTFYRRIFPWRS